MEAPLDTSPPHRWPPRRTRPAARWRVALPRVPAPPARRPFAAPRPLARVPGGVRLDAVVSPRALSVELLLDAPAGAVRLTGERRAELAPGSRARPGGPGRVLIDATLNLGLIRAYASSSEALMRTFLLLLFACTGAADITTAPRDCDPGFVRGSDGSCYQADTGEADADTDADTDTHTAPVDLDGDGYGVDDCDDTDPAVHPGAEEICDGIDQDCDGVTDDGVDVPRWYRDADGDGFGDPDGGLEECDQPAGYVAGADDCDDREASVHPGASDDTADGLDNDCDGEADEDWDPCATAGGSLVWSPAEATVREADTWLFELAGDGWLCDVTCDAGWLAFAELRAPGGATVSMPYEVEDGVGALVTVTDPRTGSAAGSCTARTSAGDVVIEVTWGG